MHLPHFRTALRAVALIALISFSAPKALAQSESVVVPSREVTLKQAIDGIAAQTDYKFVVNWEGGLDAQQKCVVPAEKLSVKELLDQMLATTDYAYQLKDRYIIIAPATKTEDGTKVIDPKFFRSAMCGMPEFNDSVEYVADPYGDSSEVPYSSIVMQSEGGKWGADNEGNLTEIVMLHFRIGKSKLERDFMDNAAALDIIDRTFADSEFLSRMNYVVITAGSSPDGGIENNKRLARERALAIKSYIMWKHPEMDRGKIATYSVGEDWSGLTKMVEEDANVPAKESVLTLLADKNYTLQQKKNRLKTIDGGKPFQYISSNMLPLLRGGVACMIYMKKEEPKTVEPEPVVTVEPVVEDPTPVVEPEVIPAPVEDKGAFIAVKTNLLYDAALIPNIGLEVYLGRGWSLEGEYNYAWWKKESSQKRYRVAAGGIELRKWFGSKHNTPLTGHFIGAYGMFGEYDMKLGSKGYQSDEYAYSAGLTYGYSKPIGRRLNLEFSLGAGYMGGDYLKYAYNEVDDCYYPLKSDKRNYFGLTKAEISLVWLIGKGVNPNK